VAKRRASRNSAPSSFWWIAPAALAVGGVAVIALTATASAASSATQVLMLDLATGPFPEQRKPSAVVIPSGLGPSDPLDVWVYFRGVLKCVDRVLGDTDGPCSSSGHPHKASHLLAQFVGSGSKALLIVPELRYDAAGMDAGALAQPGRFAAMLDEVLAHPAVAARLGARTSANVRRLGVMAHSGGILPAAAVVRDRPTGLNSVVLLDALYNSEAVFAAWIAENARRFGPGGDRRFATVYTDNGGTITRAQALAGTTRAAIDAVGLGSELLDDRSTRTLTPADYAKHAIFKRSALDHDALAPYYPRQFWSAGW
jgi:hypothetical protein